MKKKIWGIKTKILSATAFVIALSLGVTGIILYFQVSSILKDQSIKDDLVKIEYTAKQLEYLTNDVKGLSQHIIIDRDIQNFVKKVNYEEIYEEMQDIHYMKQHLNSFVGLKNYICNIAVIKSNGQIYWNQAAFKQEKEDIFEESWYKAYKKEGASTYFSQPHIIENVGKKEKVISYITELKQLEEPYDMVGKVVINMYYDTILDFIKIGSQGFDEYWWIDESGNTIFSLDKTEVNGVEDFLNGQENNENSQVFEISGKGYYIINNSIGNGWKLIAFTSENTIAKQIRPLIKFIIILMIISLILGIIILMPILLNITRPILQLTSAVKSVSNGDLSTRIEIKSHDEIEILGNGFNKMVEDLQVHINQKVKYEKTKRKMEFNLLLSQINPHFIYNTLTSVIYLARKKKTEDIILMIDSFISILQDAIKIGEDGVYSIFKQEMDIVNHYVRIQKYRYADKFELIWEIDESLLHAKVPKNLLQPIVENALFHGICASLEEDIKGIIQISVNKDEENLRISVQDNGIGIKKEKLNQILEGKHNSSASSTMRHIGIDNITKRIKFLFGQQYGIHMESKVNEGTIVIITLPYELNEK